MAEALDPLVLQFARSRPEDLARALADAELRDLADLVTQLPTAVAATVVPRLPSWQLTGLMGVLEPAAIAGILKSASTDEAIVVASHLQASRYGAILDTCTPAEKHSLRQLLDFPSYSLAALATTRFYRVNAATTCGEFTKQLARSSDTRPKPIIVLDERGKYVGMLNLQSVLLARFRNRPVGEVANKVEPLNGLTSVETALSHRLWLRYNELPVVDSRHRLLGIVSRAALQRLARSEPTESFGIEQLFTELAANYLSVCGQLIESILGSRK